MQCSEENNFGEWKNHIGSIPMYAILLFQNVLFKPCIRNEIIFSDNPQLSLNCISFLTE